MVDRWFKEEADVLTGIQLGEKGSWQRNEILVY